MGHLLPAHLQFLRSLVLSVAHSLFVLATPWPVTWRASGLLSFAARLSGLVPPEEEFLVGGPRLSAAVPPLHTLPHSMPWCLPPLLRLIRRSADRASFASPSRRRRSRSPRPFTKGPHATFMLPPPLVPLVSISSLFGDDESMLGMVKQWNPLFALSYR